MQTKLPNRQVQKPDGMQDASITNLQFNTDAGTRPGPGPRVAATILSPTSIKYWPDGLECMQHVTNMMSNFTIVCKRERVVTVTYMNVYTAVQLELTGMFLCNSAPELDL